MNVKRIALLVLLISVLAAGLVFAQDSRSTGQEGVILTVVRNGYELRYHIQNNNDYDVSVEFTIENRAMSSRPLTTIRYQEVVAQRNAVAKSAGRTEGFGRIEITSVRRI